MRAFKSFAVLVLVATTAASIAAQKIQINGAGATFPYVIYSKWFSEYNKLHPNIEINYQSQGSGAGIRQLTNQTVFFGATDGPMTNEQLLAAPGKILHVPTVLGAVVPVYNIPGVNAELKFTGPVLADIFLAKITKWNDPAITKLNAGVNLPNTDITVVHRSDGSGTTYIWVDFLSKVSPAFKTKVGVNTAVNWPTGVGAPKNEGVAGLVTQTPGSLGYVELIYALQNKIPYGAVQNKSGEFITASLESVTAAANAAAPSLVRLLGGRKTTASATPRSAMTSKYPTKTSAKATRPNSFGARSRARMTGSGRSRQTATSACCSTRVPSFRSCKPSTTKSSSLGSP